jgi:hypothetical protein
VLINYKDPPSVVAGSNRILRRLQIFITVLASFLQSFVFATSLFTAPARPLLTRAAAAERLAGALRGTAPHRSVEDTVGFATSMLSGVTWRSGGPR